MFLNQCLIKPVVAVGASVPGCAAIHNKQPVFAASKGLMRREFARFHQVLAVRASNLSTGTCNTPRVKKPGFPNSTITGNERLTWGIVAWRATVVHRRIPETPPKRIQYMIHGAVSHERSENCRGN
jgi:hypothetical protein